MMLPCETAVTIPVESTFATLGLVDLHWVSPSAKSPGRDLDGSQFGNRIFAERGERAQQQEYKRPDRACYAAGLVRNMAMASISMSSSGRQRMAWIPVEAGRGSRPCSA
jgi:hypothetical protein